MTMRAAPVNAPSIFSAQLAGAMRDELYPLPWIGSHAVVTLPEHLDVSRADGIRAELLSVINRGATALIVDMTASVSCDHSGAEAVARAYQRAIVSGTQLRLVVSAEIVRRVLSLNGIDRLVSIFPCLEAALAAEELATAAPVFILSRIQEIYDRTRETDQAVAHGIKTTAGVVTAAAVVMVFVFLTFATLSMVSLKEMGVGLAVAVLLDATIVRAVLLPATMKLLGHRNWYLPRWLSWLPQAPQPSRTSPAGQPPRQPVATARP